jgi:rRNA maturation endonuclease Nob1
MLKQTTQTIRKCNNCGYEELSTDKTIFKICHRCGGNLEIIAAERRQDG